MLALPDYEANPIFSTVERLALEYADAMTRTPVEVPDALFEALRAHFDEVQMVELTSAVAWENYRARFDHAFAIESESFSEATYCAVPIRSPSALPS